MHATVPNAVFPTLAGARWARVDLDRLSRAEPRGPGRNPLLDPGTCDRFVRAVARRLGVDLTFGGYGEDRSHLWEGHYHAPGAAVHLGVDYNVPEGTPVGVPAACEVLRVVRDPDRDGGWGGFVALALDRPYRGCRHLVYGHLAHAGLPAPGARLGPGDVVGTVAGPHENGTWYPHLHVQCVGPGAFEAHAPSLERMDGYGAAADLARHPDPTALVGVAASA